MSIDAFLRDKDYQGLVDELKDKKGLTTTEEATLGICLFRLGSHEESSQVLLSAYLKGSIDAGVEYGNYLRTQGKIKEAKIHYEELIPKLSDELLYRSLRWLGVAEFQLGNTRKGVELIESSLKGYVELGDLHGASRVKISLARTCLEAGDISRASELYKDVIRYSEPSQSSQKLHAVKGLLDLMLTYGSMTEARNAYYQAKKLLSYITDEGEKPFLLSSIAFYYKQSGELGNYGEILNQLLSMKGNYDKKEFNEWLYFSLSDYHSQLENFSEAHRYVNKLANSHGKFESPGAKVAIGRLAIAEGNYPKAVRELGQAVEMLENGNQLANLVQARLSYAYALMRLGDRAYLDVLEAAVVAMRRNQLEALLRFDVKRYRDMLFAAALEPQLASQVEGLIQELDSGLLPERAQPEEVVRLEIQTMRQLQARLAGERVHLSPGAVALLAYLSMQPGQTRPEVQLALLSERSATAANSAFKAYLAEIRKGLGADAVRVEGDYRARRYSLHPRFAVRLDIQELFKAVQEGDLARAFSAARGTFMPGLEHSDWAELQRERARSTLLALARLHIEEHRHSAPERAILICNEYLKTDPEELEIHRLRVGLAATMNNPVLLAEASAAYTQLSGETVEDLDLGG